jgi:hypothetical protein
VLTNVKIHISDLCESVSSESSGTPPKFPTTSVVQLDSPERARCLENLENAVYSVIEIQTFSNKSLIEAKAIMTKCCDAMRIMGYGRNVGPYKVGNASDKNIHRMVARFSRLIGSGDTIQRFKEED